MLGLGNPLGGDDAFGPLVLERLSRPGPLSMRDTELIGAHSDLLGYLDRFSDYELVVLVDAILDPEAGIAPPGRVVGLPEETWKDFPHDSPNAHQVSPLLAVRLFRELNPHAGTRFLLVGLCTDRVHMSHGAPGNLSEDSIAAGAREVIKAVSEFFGRSPR